MSYQIQKLPNEKIIVTIYEPPYRPEQESEINEKVAQLIVDLAPPIFCITDFSRVHVTWNDMLKTLSSHIQKAPGSATDPRLSHVIVGITHNMSLQTAINELKRKVFGDSTIRIIDTMEDAIIYCKQELARQATDYQSSTPLT